MKKRKWRFIRCIWMDKVDLGFWLVTIGLFVQYLVRFGWDHMAYTSEQGIPTGFLFLVIFYFYFAMFRRGTFAQQNYKFRKYLDKCNINPEDILKKFDDV